jgi:hypothetical protein
MTRRVYVHVGLPKTGTTYLQHMLWESRDALAADGVLFPGDAFLSQRHAFWDLLGRRLRGVEQDKVPGEWRQLVKAAREWPGREVVISEEFLVNARKPHVRRIVRELRPAEVHVVVTVRDLGRTIGSMWQQELSKGRTWPWSEFVASVRDPQHGPATAGVAFWLRQDLKRVLTVWETVVPAERIHVVVVPRAGAESNKLVELFAAANELDPATLTPAVGSHGNPSVGVAETEVLRRLNMGVAHRLNERQYLYALNRAVKPALRQRTSSTRLRLPESQRDWVAERCQEMVELLKNGRYDVVGDLDDLMPSETVDPTQAGADPEQVSDRDLAEAAIDALTATVEQFAGHWWRSRKRKGRSAASRGERMTSAGRALGYKAKVGALERADRNPVLKRAAWLYLRWTTRRRPDA